MAEVISISPHQAPASRSHQLPPEDMPDLVVMMIEDIWSDLWKDEPVQPPIEWDANSLTNKNQNNAKRKETNRARRS